MLQDKNKQTPFKENQITSEKPNIPRARSVLSGKIANSMNGGHNRTIFWKEVMAGEKHDEMQIRLHIKTLTPKTPTYQKLYGTLRAFFVPHKRIWDGAEEFTGQGGGTDKVKITEIPNLGGWGMAVTEHGEGEDYTNVCNTEHYRDSFTASYFPRIGTMELNSEETATLPKYSVLGLRGKIAIYNDYTRNKLYDEEIEEYKGNEVLEGEYERYFNNNARMVDFLQMRAKRENSYYSDYRLDLQGFEAMNPLSAGEGFSESEQLVTWADWEAKIAEARSQAENAELMPYEIIAKIRGSELLTEGRVRLIGKKTFPLNYSVITQNTYNTNSDISEEFQVLGTQGAYSYTDITIPIYAGVEFKEEGMVHFELTVSAESVFETGLERTMLNVNAMDRYRPDLKDEKLDVLYAAECGTVRTNDTLQPQEYEVIYGYKRKYSELFKMPNVIAGDLTTDNYYFQSMATEGDYEQVYEERQTETNKTFQFFEPSIETYYYKNEYYDGKKIWKDYTDLLINKNLAIPRTVEYVNAYDSTAGELSGGFYIQGQNQIIVMGEAVCLAELPVDDAIKNNFTKYGEH